MFDELPPERVRFLAVDGLVSIAENMARNARGSVGLAWQDVRCDLRRAQPLAEVLEKLDGGHA